MAIRRIVIVVFAYLCAAIAATLPMLLVGGVTANAIAAIGLLAAIYGLPVALPVILFAEFRKAGGWRLFVGAGLFLAALMTFAFTEIPYRGFNFELAAFMLASSLAGAMTYWFVAWRLFAPENPANIIAE